MERDEDESKTVIAKRTGNADASVAVPSAPIIGVVVFQQVQGCSGNGRSIWKFWKIYHSRFTGETVETAIATVTYATPETLNGRKDDANVLAAFSMDRWSLGSIIYGAAHMLYFSLGAFADFRLIQDTGANRGPALAIKWLDTKKAFCGFSEVDP
ncbi:hypothetical protein BGX34_001002 [Mortierella sp. NVP85]|nr:hypothetical protein BGX34_001002 [Mortierella sp. NVP85]